MEKVIKIFLITNVLLLFNPLTKCEKYEEDCEAEEEEPWSYHGLTNGPDKWGENYPTCKGFQQSPININSKTATLNHTIKNLIFKNYDTPVESANILNTGETVRITPSDGVNRTIEVDGVTFSLQQLHFHWGRKGYFGSEHTVDNKRYIMEGHFVHMDANNTIAVVSVLFKLHVSTYKGSSDRNNDAIKPIVEVLSKIPYKEDLASLKKRLDLSKILPKNPTKFFRYTGSLTTPPCSEGVIWSILKKTTFIGKKQVREFSRLYSTHKANATDNCRINNNFRPLQPLNNRIVYSSK